MKCYYTINLILWVQPYAAQMLYKMISECHVSRQLRYSLISSFRPCQLAVHNTWIVHIENLKWQSNNSLLNYRDFVEKHYKKGLKAELDQKCPKKNIFPYRYKKKILSLEEKNYIVA